ncbi:hypothetical protein QBC45DRAFT_489912 [Copromyces sp. CBS 386.78]|nr:hypothetical protein QBC45DRAFT_489912 [Copromyces sp. CBS 386.78]
MRPGTGLPVVIEGLGTGPYMGPATATAGACCLGQSGKVRGNHARRNAAIIGLRYYIRWCLFKSSAKEDGKLDDGTTSRRAGAGEYAKLAGYDRVIEVVMSDLTSPIIMLVDVVKICQPIEVVDTLWANNNIRP